MEIFSIYMNESSKAINMLTNVVQFCAYGKEFTLASALVWLMAMKCFLLVVEFDRSGNQVGMLDEMPMYYSMSTYGPINVR